jgi:hypothetical protein
MLSSRRIIEWALAFQPEVVRKRQLRRRMQFDLRSVFAFIDVQHEQKYEPIQQNKTNWDQQRATEYH